MSQIDQFNDTQTYAVDDFLETAAEPPVTSAGSNRNTAAHAAMLSPDIKEAGTVYQQVNDELNGLGDSPTAEAVITNAKGENLLGYRRAAADLLMDPAAGDEWKRSAIATINDPSSSLYKMRNMVATRAAEQTVEGESQEASIQRGIGAAAIQDVLNAQRAKQQIYNELQLKQDTQKAAPYVSLAEDFIPLVWGYKEARINRDLLGDDASALRTAWDSVWKGNTIADRRDWFNKIPLESREQVMQQVLEVINNNGSTILLPEEIDSVNLKAFKDTVESGSYTATDQTIDNIIGLLDIVGVGAILRKPVQALTRSGREAADATRRSWERRFTTTDVQPTSLSQTVRDNNPEMARNLHEATAKDASGDVANAVYGTGREDAIAFDIGPQAAAVDGSVQSKVFHPERNSDFEFMPDAEILDFMAHDGASWLTPSEKLGLRSSVVNDFRNATGMVNRKEMTTVDEIADGVSFKAVYGPTDSGWLNPQAAIDQAQYALKEYGVTEKDIQILAKVGENYHPISLQDAQGLGNGEYLLQINREYKFASPDAERSGFEALDVANNWLDRWFTGGGASGKGTLQSTLLDPQSMFKQEFTRGATTAGLRGARLERDLVTLATDYTSLVKSMPKPRQDKIFSKIKEANKKGQSFNYANLKAEGFSEKEVQALEKWKKSQDTLYTINNKDLVKTYRNRGYGILSHQETGTRLIVKPMARNQVGDRVKAFDPVSNQVKELTTTELTELYARNGRVARTSTPVKVDGIHVEHVIDNNAVGNTYIRALRDDDTVLNYRKGYYAVRYRDPHFIEQKLVDADGKVVLDAAGKEQWRAVATASNTVDAERGVSRLSLTTGGEYRWRKDLKGEDFATAEVSHMQAGGMSSQRIRGERLEEISGNNFLSESLHIESPIESMIHSMQSISARVTARDWIETAKNRFVAQYGDVIPKEMGRAVFPRTRAEIGEAGNKSSKMAADARSTWEYIRQMENGYVNTIDDAWKAMFNGVADFMGHQGFGRTEEVIRAGALSSPTRTAKGTAFSLMLAANPVRQFLVQSHQILSLGSVFPRYTFSRLPDDLMLMMTHHLGADPSPLLLKASGRTLEESRAMFQALKDSNIGAGVTKHELVRESLGSIADEASKARIRAGMVQKAFNPLAKAIATSRKIGFDFGEYLSSSSAFLAHYDEAIKAGRKMDLATIEELTAKSRNFVYNMDKAGALPYNHNTWSIVTQFLQVPHKAILQFTFNRGLSRPEKNRIFTYMLMMFGTNSIMGIAPGTGDIFETYLKEILPEEPGFREAVLHGLETVTLNKLFTKVYGEPVELDYSSLAPLETYGISQFISNVITEGPLAVFAASPSGSLIMGTNPRITTLLNSVAVMTGLKSNYENDPVKWSNVAKDAAGLFSGLSNAFKAQYALEYGRKIGALGGVTDSNVNSFEAIATALGLPTRDETKYRKAMDSIYKTQESFDEDVKEVFKISSRLMTQNGQTPDTWEYTTEMAGHAMSVFKGNPRALQVWNSEMRKQQANKDYRVIETIMDMCGWAKADDVKRLIDRVPNLDAEKKANLTAVCDYSLETRPDLQLNNVGNK